MSREFGHALKNTSPYLRTEALEFAEVALVQSEERNADLELKGPFENFREIENRLERLHQSLKWEGENYW